jgi:hypothetical protein
MNRLWTSIDLRLRVLLLILVIACLPVAWYLGSPLFINKTVNESFPGVALPAQNQPTAMASEAMPAPTAVAASGAMMEDGASDAMPAPTAAAASGAMMDSMESGDAQAGDTSGTAMEAKDNVAASEPVALSRGQFGEVDAIHKGQGTATVYELPDGKRVLRLEDFNVTNGPDLYVYLSGHPMPRTGDEVHQDGFEVALLKGNIGNQNYELPDDLDLSKIKSVVIYCRRFSEVFSTAELQAGA